MDFGTFLDKNKTFESIGSPWDLGNFDDGQISKEQTNNYSIYENNQQIKWYLKEWLVSI